VEFTSLAELQNRTRGVLRYPEQIPPIGFAASDILFNGYDDHATWNYRIFMADEDLFPNQDHPDPARHNLPARVPGLGEPAVACITVHAFAPREREILEARQSVWPFWQEEIFVNELYGRLTNDSNWIIVGRPVRQQTAVDYIPQSQDFFGDSLPACCIAQSVAAYLDIPVIYMVITTVYGHPEEDQAVLCDLADHYTATLLSEIFSSPR